VSISRLLCSPHAQYPTLRVFDELDFCLRVVENDVFETTCEFALSITPESWADQHLIVILICGWSERSRHFVGGDDDAKTSEPPAFCDYRMGGEAVVSFDGELDQGLGVCVKLVSSCLRGVG